MSAGALERAVALHQAGQLDAAEAAYRAVLAADPRDAHAMHYLGLVELQRERAEQAVAWIEQALALRPREPAFLCNLGQARRRLGEREAAEAAYRGAVKLAPKMFQAWHNLAALYEGAGDDAQAIECFSRARALCDGPYPGDAGFAAACRRHGHRLLELGQPGPASTLFARACEIEPGEVDGWRALASGTTLAGRPLAAMAAFERALALAPDDARLYNNRANAWRDAGQPERAMADYAQALAHDPADRDARSNLLFTALSAAADAAQLAALQREHGAALALPGGPPAAGSGAARPRIGFVSADLRAHPVGWFMLGWFAHRDRAAAHVTVYHGSPIDDAVSARIRAGCDEWVACAGVGDEALATRIRQDGIDLLVDLAGHTADNRLGVFARRPAPRQLTFLGYAGSSGLDCFDARIADAATEPEDAADDGSEPVLRLEGSYFCYSPPADVPLAAALPLHKNRFVTFGCATQLGKLTERTLALWATALAGVPRYRLVLRSTALGDPLVKQAVSERMVAAGIDRSRLRLEGPQPLARYLKAWRQVDIALDTVPFNLATQSCDALWMGVPVVTLSGDRHAGRIGASLLGALGLDELVADSPAAFADICQRLAADPKWLATLRAGLRARMQAPGGLADGAGFAARLDAAFASVLNRPAGSRGAWSR
ncbi:MAG: tetratricopeptide repeat protein [Rhodocyclaceae bacterium]|nr:tetratricopeptide repeat protein [Rhodocyclaceae bacterium]